MPRAFVFSDKKVRFVEKFLPWRISFVYLFWQTVLFATFVKLKQQT
jgi:hypothetical protein